VAELNSLTAGSGQRTYDRARHHVSGTDIHASISTTLNIYTHVVDASHRQAIESVERQLFPSVPKLEEPDTVSDAVSARTRVG
jgi:hypothetical protein